MLTAEEEGTAEVDEEAGVHHMCGLDGGGAEC